MPPDPPQTVHFRWSSTRVIKGKPLKFPEELAEPANWSTEYTDIFTLAEHHQAGYTWMPGLLDGGAKRKAREYCNHLDCLAIDVDNTRYILDSEGKRIKDENDKYLTEYSGELTLENAIAHPFIRRHAALIQESASSKPDYNKFRIVFVLPRPIEGFENISLAYQYLHTLFPGPDPSCKNSDRVFYGAEGRTPYYINPYSRLDESFFEGFRAFQKKEFNRIRAVENRAREAAKRFEGKGNLSPEELARLMAPYFPARGKPGSGTYPDCQRLLAGLVHTFGVQKAIDIAQGSPLAQPAEDWHLQKRAESLAKNPPARPCNFGTVVWIAKQYGFTFPSPGHGSKKELAPATKKSAKSSGKNVASDSKSIESDWTADNWNAPIVIGNCLYRRKTKISNFRIEVVGAAIPGPEDRQDLGCPYWVRVHLEKGKPFEGMLTPADMATIKDLIAAIHRFPDARPPISFTGERVDLLTHIAEQADGVDFTTQPAKNIAKRYGKQVDGGWIFPAPAPEFCSPNWFYQGVKPDNYLGFRAQKPGALKHFLDALAPAVSDRYFMQLIFMLGFTLAATHRDEILSVHGSFPLLNPFGGIGSGKSYAAMICSRLLGHEPKSPETEAQLLDLLDIATNLPLFFDDPVSNRTEKKMLRFDFHDLSRRAFGGAKGGNAKNTNRRITRSISICTNPKLGTDDDATNARFLNLNFRLEDRPDQLIDLSDLAPLVDDLSASFFEFVNIPFDLAGITRWREVIQEMNVDRRTVKGIAIVAYATEQVMRHILGTEEMAPLEAYLFDEVVPTQVEGHLDLDPLNLLDDWLTHAIGQGKAGPWNLMITPRTQPDSVAIPSTVFDEIVAANGHLFDRAQFKQIVKAVQGGRTNVSVRYVMSQDVWRKYVQSDSPEPSISTLLGRKHSRTTKSYVLPKEVLPLAFESIQNALSIRDTSD